MTALDSLEDLKVIAGRLSAFDRSFEPKVSEVATSIVRRFSALAEKTLEYDDLERLHSRVEQAFKAGKLETLNKKDWRQLPWVLWSENNPLIEYDAVVDEYSQILQQRRSSSFVSTLMFVYLRNYPFSSTKTGKVRALIRGQLETAKSAKLVTWRNRHRKYHLFSGEEAADVLAKAITNSEASVREVLDDAGLVGELEYSGLAKEAYRNALAAFKSQSTGRIRLKNIEKLADWSVSDSELRYPELKVGLINALLLPWVSETPDEELQQFIVRFLVNQFGDPRIQRGAWHDVDISARTVIERWLVKWAIEDFFTILDKTAKDSHWRYRRAFWLAYYEKNALDGAWIALGQRAYFFARRAFGEEFSAATLVGAGVNQDQSVLLLKIGNLIFAEWSHNGRCRAWYVEDEAAPSLHQPRYNGKNLRSNSNKIVERYSEPGIPHHNSESGHWQALLASYIRKETGITVSHDEYMRGLK